MHGLMLSAPRHVTEELVMAIDAKDVPKLPAACHSSTSARALGDGTKVLQDTNQKYPQYCWEFHDRL